MREGYRVSPPLACSFLLCIILLYSLQSVYLLERRLVHLVPPISLSYAVHFTAIIAHQFIDGENTTIHIPYNLVFSENTRDIIPLPAPALFDSIARRGYMIMLDDI